MRLSLFAAALATFGTGEAVAQSSLPPLRTTRAALTLGVDPADDIARGAFGSASQVRSAPDGRIYVLDGRECRVKVFSASGAFLRAVARSGSGPGELSCRAMVVTTEDEGLHIADLDQARVVRYSFDGEHVSTVPMPAVEGDAGRLRSTPLRHGFRLRPDGVTLLNADNPASKFDPHTYLVLFGGPPRRTDTLAVVRRDLALARLADGRGRPFNARFGEGGAWDIWRDSVIAIVDGYAGTVKWIAVSPSGATPVRTASLGAVGRPVTDADRRALERRAPADPLLRAMRVVPASVLEPPPRWSIATEARFADDGALWVGAPTEEGSPRMWTVFPVTGAPFRVAIPAGLRFNSARGDTIYCTGTNEDEVPVVRVLRLL